MVVGFADYRDGRYRIDNYGFCPEPDLLEEECLRLVGAATVEELRKTPLFIDRPANLGFVDFARELVPMPKIWQEIASGRAERKTQKAIKAAERAVRKEEQVIFESGDHILAGARLEAAMVKETGRPMRPNSGCGALNSEVLGKLVFSKSSKVDKLQSGQKLEGKKVFCKNCGLCGRPINRDIESGFCCPHCGGVYSGVC